jgi:hypothetical protein
VLALFIGVGYASFRYGSSRQAVPTSNNNAPLTNNNISNPNQSPSIIDLNNFPSLSNTNTANNQTNTTNTPSAYTGASFITIDYPKENTPVKWGSYTLKGSVSPNTTKVVVTAKGLNGGGGIEEPETWTTLDQYTLSLFKLGDTTWSYQVAEKYNNLWVWGNSFTVKAYFTDGTTKEVTRQVSYLDAPVPSDLGKPVIYLYPPKTTAVSVNVKPTNGIYYSEPTISSNGWNVTAQPSGALTTADGKVWPYLFWEGFAANFITPKEGFVVAKQDVSNFFDSKLSFLGLNQKEITDFKDFWLSRLQDKPYYFITFIPQGVFNTYAPLTVSPTPQTVIRVFFDYRGLDQPVVVAPEKLTAGPARNGFTVVEWGGRLYR